MSLLQRIAETQGASKAEKNERDVNMAVEQSKPDAVQQDKNGREAYGNALAAEPSVELAEEAPEAGEQEEFTKAERAMTEMIFGQGSNEVVAAVKADRDPVMGVGNMGSQIINEMTSQFPNLTEDALFSLGESAIEQLVELVESASSDVNFSEAQMTEALSIGVGQWMENNPELMDSQESYRAGAAPEQLEEEVQQPQQQPVATPPIQNV